MKLVFILVIVIVLGLFPDVVAASDVLNRTQNDYRFQLDTYRKTYDEFVLRRTEFENNSSFANQEVMVLAAREMLMKRDKVWQTYFQVLKVKLWEVEGMEENQKNELIGQTDEFILMLEENEDLVKGLETRVPLLEAAVEINNQEDIFENASYQIIMELTLARFKWAMQQLRVFNSEVDAAVEVQVRSNSERQLKRRAVGEVELILDSVEENYEEVYDDAHKDSGMTNYRNRQKNAVENLIPLYSDMLRAYAIVDEITQDLIQ